MPSGGPRGPALSKSNFLGGGAPPLPPPERKPQKRGVWRSFRAPFLVSSVGLEKERGAGAGSSRNDHATEPRARYR